MEPIVYGIKKRYSSCMKVERVNYHDWTSWHELIGPLASPEFALLDNGKNILYRWFGVIAEDDFAAVLDPLCRG
ncbi:MAG: hypothetical protein QY306_02545 [Anaerolineales bacterium]|nr:MAG: hypothetical protein QY306_02545 [Anaerolineales bacterium]